MTQETINKLEEEINDDTDIHLIVNPKTFNAWSLPNEYKGIKIYQDEWCPLNQLFSSRNEPSC